MTLQDLNTMDQRKLREHLYECCGCTSWSKMMLTHFPAEDISELLENAKEVWSECSEDEWKEAFAHHPRIGDLKALEEKYVSTTAAGEQAAVLTAPPEILRELEDANREYENKFGYIFIVFATGKSPEEMLEIIRTRMKNTPAVEIKVAAEEQAKIMQLRLEKLLQGG